MGFTEDMQKSLNYTRGLRKKRVYFRDKTFDPKWDKERQTDLPEIQKHQLLATKNRNEAYLKEIRDRNKKGIIAGVSAVSALIYFVLKMLS